MGRLRQVRYAFDWLFHRSRREAEMDRELRSHLEMEAEANRAAGMSPEEARRRAGARLGSAEAAKEACREATGSLLVETFFLDLRHGLRLVRRSPGFSAAAVLTLALGIGSTTSVASLVDGILLRPFSVPDPERLVVIWETDRVQGTDREGASLPDYLDFRAQNRKFEELAAYHRRDFTLNDGEDPERVSGARVSATFFPLLGVEAVAGRAILAEEEQPGRDRVAVLSNGLWHRRFGGDPGVVGRVLTVDGEPRTVVGVMPPEASLPGHTPELWVPLAPQEQDRIRGRHVFRVYGRLRAGTDVAEAQVEMDGIMARLEQEYQEDNRGRGARVVPVHADVVGGVRPTLRLLAAAVAAVLLVACINVAGLLLARGAARGEDIALRAALGAGRRRLLRQLLTESLLLAGLGAGLGILLGWWGCELLKGLAPPGTPRLAEVGIDGRILAVVGAVTLVTWLLFGLLPGLKGSRSSLRADLAPRGHGRPSRPDRQSFRSALVVGEVALSLALLVTAGLLLRSFWQLQAVDPGFEPRGLVVARVDLPASRYPFPGTWPVLDWPAGTQFAEAVEARVASLPGVEGVSVALYGPLDGGWTTRVEIEGRPAASLEEVKEVHYRPVGATYFETVGVTLLSGRGFSRDDRPGAPLVAVVNRAFVRTYFPAEDPLAEGVSVYGKARKIVGVVHDERFFGQAEDPQPTVYLPSAQNPQPTMTVMVRADRPAAALVPEIRSVIRTLDRDLAVYDVHAVEEALAGTLAERRFALVLLAAFAVTALGLSGVGLFGLLAYLVNQRTQEIGIRMALGAARGQVVGMVLGRALLLVAAGLGLGFAAALGTGRLVAGLLYGVGALDPRTLTGVALLLLATAGLAAWVPARRASAVDPQRALRQE